MLAKTTGCILMIIGTAVGAGMLALPVATAEANVQTTLLMMLFAWLIMTIAAVALLEVNLWLPEGANFLSMAQSTLGKPAKIFSGGMFILLFYSLLCAYLSATGDVLQGLLVSFKWSCPRWLATVISLLLLGGIVYKGISTVDIVNRCLMGLKFLAYFAVVFMLVPHIARDHLQAGTYVYHTSTLMVIVTSFGFANVIPTIRHYLHSDKNKIVRVILTGSLITFFIYTAWVLTVQGLLPRQTDKGLLAVLHSSEPNSLLIKNISLLIQSTAIHVFSGLFISICALTSFLGVAISLVDFIKDGLQMVKTELKYKNFIASMLAFLPPLFIVLLKPDIFIKALSYAGIICIIILVLLPAAMLYYGRRKKLEGSQVPLLPLGQALPVLIMIISAVLIAVQIF